MNEKPILAIETSEKLCGASVYINDEKYSECTVMFKNSHSEKIFICVETALKNLNYKLEDCAHIAVSSGPGSFTGLRIGLSTAKGLAFGANLPLVLVPTFEALALQILPFTKMNEEFVIVSKVNVQELYYAKFQNDGNNYKFADNLRVIQKEELHGLSSGVRIFGNTESKLTDFVKLVSPVPHIVAAWSSKYGKELLTYDYDYLEPQYLKDFVIKRKEG